MRGAYLPTPHAHGKEKENHGRDRGGVGYLPPPHAHGKENHGRERGGTFPPLHTHKRRNMDAKGGRWSVPPPRTRKGEPWTRKEGGRGGGPFTHIIHIITLFTFPLRTHTERRIMDAKGGVPSPLCTHTKGETWTRRGGGGAYPLRAHGKENHGRERRGGEGGDLLLILFIS